MREVKWYAEVKVMTWKTMPLGKTPHKKHAQLHNAHVTFSLETVGMQFFDFVLSFIDGNIILHWFRNTFESLLCTLRVPCGVMLTVCGWRAVPMPAHVTARGK